MKSDPAAVRRPWGTYMVLEEGPGFRIKRIHVEPGGRFTLHSHEHRSEHWVVVAGRASVTRNGIVTTLGSGQSTFAPPGMRHTIENRTGEPLHLIEVHIGSHLGDDDVLR